jgi:phosphosulfolactate phosphohydrolase-like enzyme
MFDSWKLDGAVMTVTAKAGNAVESMNYTLSPVDPKHFDMKGEDGKVTRMMRCS